MKNLDRYARGAVESFFELRQFRKMAVTKRFVVEWLLIQSLIDQKNRAWADLPDKVQKSVVGKELGRLRRNKKIEEVDANEIIHRDKIYRAVLR